MNVTETSARLTAVCDDFNDDPIKLIQNRLVLVLTDPCVRAGCAAAGETPLT